MFLSRKSPQATAKKSGLRPPDFRYLPPESCYLDSACQTLRPQPVIDAEMDYYTQTNACGGRVKYRWGIEVDRKVQDARKSLLAMAGKSARDYAVAFTLNTTYGINLVLQQLPSSSFEAIVTSDIEHNSVFLPTMTWAKRHEKKRTVLTRADDGSIPYKKDDVQKSIVLVNTMSNIDGRVPGNLERLADDVHAQDGILLLDAAQGFVHDTERLRRTDFDAVFGSGHKMYGPSIGFIIIKRTLLDTLDPFFIGGGTVTDVKRDTFELLRTGDEAHAVLEPGLQDWAGILGLGQAVKWLKETDADEAALADELYAGIKDLSRLTLLNTAPSPIVSFFVDGLDAHRLALYLDEQNIMCRSGYFCCHSSLLHDKKLPPLLRVSLGLHNTADDVRRFCAVLQKILSVA